MLFCGGGARVFTFWLGGWERRKQGGNSSLARVLVLGAECFPWSLSGGGEGKNGAMLCKPDLGGYILKSKLAGLFGSVVMNSEPLWELTNPGMQIFLQPII